MDLARDALAHRRDSERAPAAAALNEPADVIGGQGNRLTTRTASKTDYYGHGNTGNGQCDERWDWATGALLTRPMVA